MDAFSSLHNTSPKSKDSRQIACLFGCTHMAFTEPRDYTNRIIFEYLTRRWELWHGEIIYDLLSVYYSLTNMLPYKVNWTTCWKIAGIAYIICTWYKKKTTMFVDNTPWQEFLATNSRRANAHALTLLELRSFLGWDVS